MFKLWYGKIEGEYLHYVCHFLAGYMIAAIAIKNLGMADGIAVAVMAAAGKEIADQLTGEGTPEAKAAAITILGALFAAGTLFM
jgi:hypothetical protein